MFSVPYNSAGITSVLYSLPMDLHVFCPVQQCWYYQCPVQPPHGSSCSLSRTTVLVLRVSCTASPWIFMFSVPYNSAGITSVLYSLPMDLQCLCPVQQCWYYQCPVQPPHGSSCSLSRTTVLVLRVSCTASFRIFMFSVPYNSAGITSVLYSLL